MINGLNTRKLKYLASQSPEEWNEHSGRNLIDNTIRTIKIVSSQQPNTVLGYTRGERQEEQNSYSNHNISVVVLYYLLECALEAPWFSCMCWVTNPPRVASARRHKISIAVAISLIVLYCPSSLSCIEPTKTNVLRKPCIQQVLIQDTPKFASIQ